MSLQLLTVVVGIAHFVLAFAVNQQLSDLRLCGDQHCKAVISGAVFISNGNFINNVGYYEQNQSIHIISKSAGSRKDLWNGKMEDGRNGYFHKDDVVETSIFIGQPAYIILVEESEHERRSDLPWTEIYPIMQNSGYANIYQIRPDITRSILGYNSYEGNRDKRLRTLAFTRQNFYSLFPSITRPVCSRIALPVGRRTLGDYIFSLFHWTASLLHAKASPVVDLLSAFALKVFGASTRKQALLTPYRPHRPVLQHLSAFFLACSCGFMCSVFVIWLYVVLSRRRRFYTDEQKLLLTSLHEETFVCEKDAECMEDDLEALNSAIRQLEQQLDENEAANSKRQLDVMSAENRGLRGYNKSAALRLQKMRDDESQLAGALRDKESALQQQEVLRAQHEQRLADASGRYDRCFGHLTSVDSSSQQHLRHMAALADERAQLASACSDIQLQLDQAHALAQQLDAAVTKSDTDLAHTTAALDTKSAELAHVRARIAQLANLFVVAAADKSRTSSSSSGKRQRAGRASSDLQSAPAENGLSNGRTESDGWDLEDDGINLADELAESDESSAKEAKSAKDANDVNEPSQDVLGLSDDEMLEQMLQTYSLNYSLSALEAEQQELQTKLQALDMEEQQLSSELEQKRAQQDLLQVQMRQALAEREQATTKLNVLNDYFSQRELQLQKQLGHAEALLKDGQQRQLSTADWLKLVEADLSLYKQQCSQLRDEITQIERNHKAQVQKYEAQSTDGWLRIQRLQRERDETRHEAAALRQRLTQLQQQPKAAVGYNRPAGALDVPAGLAPTNSRSELISPIANESGNDSRSSITPELAQLDARVPVPARLPPPWLPNGPPLLPMPPPGAPFFQPSLGAALFRPLPLPPPSFGLPPRAAAGTLPFPPGPYPPHLPHLLPGVPLAMPASRFPVPPSADAHMSARLPGALPSQVLATYHSEPTAGRPLPPTNGPGSGSLGVRP